MHQRITGGTTQGECWKHDAALRTNGLGLGLWGCRHVSAQAAADAVYGPMIGATSALVRRQACSRPSPIITRLMSSLTLVIIRRGAISASTTTKIRPKIIWAPVRFFC